jgi:hypothetical protein
LSVRTPYACWEPLIKSWSGAQPWCKGFGRHLQDHPFVEHELASMPCSLENKVSLCALGGLYIATPLQHRRTSLNKEGITRRHHHVSTAVISSFTGTCMVVYLA